MNVIIPMAGLGSRFTDYGFTINKYLLPVNLQLETMIEHAITSLKVPINSHFILIIREENGLDHQLRTLLNDICSRHTYTCTILSTNKMTEGPTCTCYLAKELINNDRPLIISNSDQILDWNYQDFAKRSANFDGCVLTYTPDYEIVLGQKDKHSFVKCNDSGIPVQYIEKVAISNEALVGVHYYKRGSLFIEAADYLFANNIRAPNGEFYISYTYQALIDLGYTTGTYKLSELEHFYPVGEPVDYFTYYNKMCAFRRHNISQIETLIGDRVSITTCDQSDEKTIKCESGNTYIYVNGYCITIRGVAGSVRPFSDYVRGWLIGDFEPSIMRITDFELGILTHKANEMWPFHYHMQSQEINFLIKGHMQINSIDIKSGETFIFEKNTIACPKFLEECTILCIKIPSCPKDKHII